MQAATGRALTLRGELRLSRSLWPTLEVNDALLANLPGGTRADMALLRVGADHHCAPLQVQAAIRKFIDR